MSSARSTPPTPAAAILNLLDPDMARTYLDPSAAYPRPQICRGRSELAAARAQQAECGLRAQLEEVQGILH